MRVASTILFLLALIVSNASNAAEPNLFDVCSEQFIVKPTRHYKKSVVPNDYIGDKYEHLSLISPKGKKLSYRVATDKMVVRIGEEFKIKVIFDKSVKRIEILNPKPDELVGVTTKEDIARGEYIVTHTAGRFSSFYVYIHTKTSSKPIVYSSGVYAVSSEMYDEVKRQESEAIATGDREMLDKFYANLSMHVFSDRTRAQMSNSFEYLSIAGEGGNTADYKMLSDRTIIASGDTVRLKIVFNPEVVKGVEIDGVAETTAEDVARGRFEVKMAPEKTSLYNVYIFMKDGTYVPMCGRVIVVAPEEYEAAQTQEQALKQSSQRDALYLYYDTLAGGSIIDLMKKHSIHK